MSGARPMWAEDGSLDYQGQERYDVWATAKVRQLTRQRRSSLCAAFSAEPLTRLRTQDLSHDGAVAAFCRIYAEAHTPERFKANFFPRATRAAE